MSVVVAVLVVAAAVDDAFTGSISGSSATLTLPQGLGTITNLAVRLDGANLIVSWPQSDGTLAAVTFISATAGDYNRAVSALQIAAASASAAQASSSAAAAAAEAQQQLYACPDGAG